MESRCAPLAWLLVPLRDALRKAISDNIEYGEAILTMLQRKAECQLQLIAPVQTEGIVEFWHTLLDMHTVQTKLSAERYRLSTIRG